MTVRVYFVSGLFRFKIYKMFGPVCIYHFKLHGLLSFRACFVSGLFRFGAVSIQVGPVSFRACYLR